MLQHLLNKVWRILRPSQRLPLMMRWKAPSSAMTFGCPGTLNFISLQFHMLPKMALIPLSIGLSLGQAIGLTAIAVVLYHAFNIIYNLRFHPLSSFPGPLARRASRLPYTLSILNGRLHTDTAALHRRYGPVVRVAPNELAFADPSSWRDVMGGGSKELAKWGEAYLIPEFMPPHLQNTVDKEHHKMLRRAVAPGFSDQSLRAQEGLVAGYIGNLIERLRETCAAGGTPEGSLGPDAEKSGSGSHSAVVDLERWYRFTVFDIIGDLALGESFGCLNGADFHPWIRGMNDAGKVMWLLTAASMYPIAKKVSNWLFATVATRGFEMHNNMVKPMMERRLAQGANRPDMINPIIMKKDEWVSGWLLELHTIPVTWADCCTEPHGQ